MRIEKSRDVTQYAIMHVCSCRVARAETRGLDRRTCNVCSCRVPLKRRSHMTIGMTTGWQTGRHTDRRYRSHMTTGVQTCVPTDRRYVHT